MELGCTRPSIHDSGTWFPYCTGIRGGIRSISPTCTAAHHVASGSWPFRGGYDSGCIRQSLHPLIPHDSSLGASQRSETGRVICCRHSDGELDSCAALGKRRHRSSDPSLSHAVLCRQAVCTISSSVFDPP